MDSDPMIHESTLRYPNDLDKGILAIRSREKQEVVPEISVHENIVASSPMMEVTDSVVGMEAAPVDLQHSTELKDMSKHSDGAQTEAAEEERFALPANEEDKVMDEQHEGSGGSSSLVSPAAGGNEVGGQAQQKNRKKRANNWTANETDVLLSQVVSAMDERSTRSGMLSRDEWEAISLQVPGRDWKECQERMDTLKKPIKKYCDAKKKKFEELTEVDFQALQPNHPACFKVEWYIQIRDHCLWRPKKRKTGRAESVPSPSTMGSGLAPCTLTSGNTFGERGVQHPHAGPSNVAATTPGGIESTVTAFESTVCFFHIDWLWLLMLAIGFHMDERNVERWGLQSTNISMKLQLNYLFYAGLCLKGSLLLWISSFGFLKALLPSFSAFKVIFRHVSSLS